MATAFSKHNKWYVHFRDVDGLNYISSWSGANTNWSASQDSGDVMLFEYEEAHKVMEELKTHSRYQGGPDDGFYKVNITRASDEMYSKWCGPSQELTSYLTEGNSKEDLVKVLWDRISLSQRRELESEAEEYFKDYN